MAKVNQRALAVTALVTNLGYEFSNPRLLEHALTHASVSDPNDLKAPADNERLEFLGDRVLGLLVADSLISNFPEADEGKLSARLHSLVDKNACARVGEKLGVGDALRLSAGETKTGGRRKAGVIADAVEAILAAVYRDGGLDAARAVFEKAWADELSTTVQPAVINPKSALQEWAQGQGHPLPTYTVVARTGTDHAPTFKVEAVVEGYEPAVATGRSRQEAEKAAAVTMLKREGVI